MLKLLVVSDQPENLKKDTDSSEVHKHTEENSAYIS